MARSGEDSFYEVLTAAVADIAEHGFDDSSRVAKWQAALRKAAETTLVPVQQLDEMLKGSMRDIYRRMVEKQGVLKHHPGIQRWTIEKLKPRLRLELDKRILASADLIKLNRQQSIAHTLRRFSGWATSIPAGGTDQTDRNKIKAEVRKPLAQMNFEARRVAIDQGHKLIYSINDIVAVDNGAIAARWKSHWRQPGYNYREDHKERDGLIYAIRGSWAFDKGLMNKGAGYTDEITEPAEEPFCRCLYTYLYALRSLPDDMLTAKGRSELERTRVA
jgi:hypothetical protein